MAQRVVHVSDIAKFLTAEHAGAEQEVLGISPLTAASSHRLAFVADPAKHEAAVAAALAEGSVLLFPVGVQLPNPGAGAVIAVDNPRAAFAAVVQEFFAPIVEPGISGTAVVHPTASVASTAHIGEYSVIGPGATIGDGVEIRNHVVIAANVQVGRGSLIKSHAVIGEEGFGVDKDAAGNNVRLPHLGSVVLGDHVEVGNFTTVCSGTIAPTKVGDYSKIDDHVHVSHNVQIGKNAIITACAEISGSVVIGDDVWIGPNASLIQGISVGARSLIGIAAVVTRSVPEAEVHFGNPAKRIRSNA